MTLDVAVKAHRGTFALDASFRSAGGVTALFGRSGAGKSSVVQMVAGLQRPGEGRIVLNGRTLFDSAAGTNVPARRRRTGLVFQEPRLFPHLSVRSNLLYGRWAGRRQGTARLDAVVALLGLERLLERRPETLSGGEAQRVAIGRAFLAGPEILLMDEPLSQLDGARRAEILPYLDQLASEGGVPILYVSHAVDEVARLADTVVVLSEGRVVAAGPIDEVFARIDLGAATGRYEAGVVLTGRVAAHDHAYNLSHVRIGASELVVPELARSIGAAVRLRIRARDVALALQTPPLSSIRNVLPAAVESLDLEPGAYAEVLLGLPGPEPRGRLRARITRKSAEALGLKPGMQVHALIKSVSVEADRRSGR